MFGLARSVSVIKASSRRLNNNSSLRVFHSTKNSKSTTAAESTVNAVRAEATASAARSGIFAFPKKHPFVFQLVVATAKTSAADVVVQTTAERKSFSEIDWKRNGIFVVFGFAYLGGFQWWLMVHKYRQWFPTMDRFAKLSLAKKLQDKAGMLDAMKMVVFDVVVHLPMIYFPTYYTVKELVGGHSWNPLTWAADGVTKYSRNLKEDLTAMVQLWGPSDCVQFILPVHIRMPFRHLVSFFWTSYVSFTRGAIDDDDDQEPLPQGLPTSQVQVE